MFPMKSIYLPRFELLGEFDLLLDGVHQLSAQATEICLVPRQLKFQCILPENYPSEKSVPNTTVPEAVIGLHWQCLPGDGLVTILSGSPDYFILVDFLLGLFLPQSGVLCS